MENNYIECNENKCFGQPSLKGKRLTVYDIVTKLFYEDSLSLTLNDYRIGLEEAKSAIKYCMTLSCQRDDSLGHFCDGCILRTLAEGWDFKRDDYIEIENNEKITISRDKKQIFLGSLDDMENSEFGKVTWLIAEELYKKWFGKDNNSK